MRKLLFIAAFLAAADAYSATATAWMDVSRRQVRWNRPVECTVDGVTYSPPTDELLAKAYAVVDFEDTYGDLRYRVISWNPPSIRAFTAQEKAAQDAADAAAQAQAEAQATLPATFSNGIAVTNAQGHWVEFIPDGTNVLAQTLAIQISHSPIDPATRAAMKAAALSNRAEKVSVAKAAKAKGNGVPALAERVAAMEALAGVE